MTEPLDRLNDIARRYTMLAIQLAGAYNQAQSGLKLNELLLPGTLSSAEGRARSLATLDQLREITDTHRAAYAKFMEAWAGETGAVLAGVPAEQRRELREGTMDRFQRHIALQAEFYDNRARWIDAAGGICRLVDEANPAFGDDGLRFASDADAARFEELLTAVGDTHRREVALYNERMAQVRAAGDGQVLH